MLFEEWIYISYKNYLPITESNKGAIKVRLPKIINFEANELQTISLFVL